MNDNLNANSKYLIVSEDLRPNALHQLNRMLDKANIVSEIIPVKYFSYVDKSKNTPTEETELYWNTVRNEIADRQPRVVIALGDEALRAITGYRGMEDWQGSILQCLGSEQIPCVPTFHPASLLRGGGKSHWYFPASMKALQRAKMVGEGQVRVSHPRMTELNIVIFKELLHHWIETKAEVAFDIETSDHGGEHVTCISFADSIDHGYSLNFMQDRDMYDSVQINALLRTFFESPAIAKIGQNAYNYDIPYIKRVWNINVENFVWDTMVAHAILHPELPHGLAYLTSHYTTIPYYKYMNETNLLYYNVLDSVATLWVKQGEKKEMEARKMLHRYTEYAHKLCNPLREMYIRGVKIDLEYKEILKKDLKKEIREVKEQINAIYRKHINTNRLEIELARWMKLRDGGRKSVKLPNPSKGKFTRRNVDSAIARLLKEIKKHRCLNTRSSLQVQKFLFVTLGLPAKTKDGRLTTDQTALEELYIKTQHEFLKWILTARNLLNMYSRFGRMQTDELERVHSTYKLVETGRLSSGRFEAK